MRFRERRPLATIMMSFVIAVCLGFLLSACGKKSALTPPEEAEYPRQYPRQ